MAQLRFVLQTSPLLVLALCWSANANTTPSPLPPGFVTRFITPMANFSLEKLVGRWYVADVFESTPIDLPPGVKERLCLQITFRYDDNGTLVAEPESLLDGVRTSPQYSYPVNANGVWDKIYIGVSGEAVLSASNAVVHVDERFLAVASCDNKAVKDCSAFLAVRHVADADRREQLEELRRRLASAGVDAVDGSSVSTIQPCHSVATAAPDLSAQSGVSAPDAE